MRSSIYLFGIVALVGGCGTVDDGVGESSAAVTARKGVDYSFGRPSPSGLKSAGYSFAARYYSYDNGGSHGKILFAAEAKALLAAGVDIVSNWEYAADDALGGFNSGVADAKVANSQAAAAGAPANRPIYFSVDFDATPAQQGPINDYMDGVASVLGRNRTGAYGGYYVVKRLFDAGKITFGWQTYAWSGGQWDARAQLRQVQNGVNIAGGACDIDQSTADDFGQWGHSAAWGAKFVSQSFPYASTPITIRCGESLAVDIVLRNVGTSTWDANTKLGTTMPRDRASKFAAANWAAPNRASHVTGTVAPNGTYQFNFTFQAPTGAACVPGMYHEYFGVVQEAVSWFSDSGEAGPPDNQLEALINLVPANAPAGDMALVGANADLAGEPGSGGDDGGVVDEPGSGGGSGSGGGGGTGTGGNGATGGKGGCSVGGEAGADLPLAALGLLLLFFSRSRSRSWWWRRRAD
ncbi:MAG: hypothetical protein JWN44_5645 [Myxococcales bacterium]|nr:hypothetical protein [Myxococcales bacterium]